MPCPYDHDKEQEKRLRDLNFIVDLVARKNMLEEEAGQVRITEVWLLIRHANTCFICNKSDVEER